MASSPKRRPPYIANIFPQHFQIPLNSSDHLKNSVSHDFLSTNSINDVKNNYCETELGDFYAEFLGGHVKSDGDQSIIDALSYIESANSSVEKLCHISPTCMKNNNNTRMQKIEALLNNNDLHFTPKKKDQNECCFSDGHFMDCDISNILVSEKMASSDIESHLIMGSEKPGPWWRTAGKDELASMVAQKSLETIENCDLPHPQPKHFSHRYPKGMVDYDKFTSSLNQKAETISLNADGCSFQDSNCHFSSNQTKESGPSDKDCQLNPENSSMAELLEALCHSQTRAREAEKAAQEAYNEKEHILSLFFRQASQLFAYKQWFHMLQLENLCIQLRNKNQPLLNIFPAKQLKKSRGRAEKKESGNRRWGIGQCFVAFAVSLSLAGAGLLLGWTMGWMFPSL